MKVRIIRKTGQNNLINGHPLFADHSCIKSKVAFLQIIGLFMYFLNMYSLFSLKSCIAQLQGSENRVSMEQYSVAQFLSIKIEGIEMHLQKENAHIYPLRALKLLFDNINYLPDIQPCRNTENTNNYDKIP